MTYTAVDKSGNDIFAKRTVELKDATPPAVTLKGDPLPIVEAMRGARLTEEGAAAVDVIDGDVTASITAEILHSYDPEAAVVEMAPCV